MDAGWVKQERPRYQDDVKYVLADDVFDIETQVLSNGSYGWSLELKVPRYREVDDPFDFDTGKEIPFYRLAGESDDLEEAKRHVAIGRSHMYAMLLSMGVLVAKDE